MNVQAAAEGSTWIDVEGRIALEEKDIEEDNWQRKIATYDLGGCYCLCNPCLVCRCVDVTPIGPDQYAAQGLCCCPFPMLCGTVGLYERVKGGNQFRRIGAGEGENPARVQSFEAGSRRYYADYAAGYRVSTRACFPVTFPYRPNHPHQHRNHGHGPGPEAKGTSPTKIEDKNQNHHDPHSDDGEEDHDHDHDDRDRDTWAANYRRTSVDELEGCWVSGCCFPYGLGCDYRQRGPRPDEIAVSGFRCKYCLVPSWERAKQRRIANTNHFYSPPWRDASQGTLPTVRGAVTAYPCSNCMLGQYTCGLRLYPCRWNCAPVALNRPSKVGDHDMLPLPLRAPSAEDESLSGIKQPSMESKSDA
mmetsp:Transcript_1766/g.3401  ORF Transcript_1766/g.3401 Transcript_1766/m.3401 type:complete len:360 (+) Transcript_1766:57-1136(+)